jgi:hypothetical protein
MTFEELTRAYEATKASPRPVCAPCRFLMGTLTFVFVLLVLVFAAHAGGA